MLGPLDVQVLTNRTLEVQKIQGAALRQPEDEGEMAKNRLDQEIQRQERQVQRKKEMVDGRINDEERRRSRDEKNPKHNKDKDDGTDSSAKDGVEFSAEGRHNTRMQKTDFRGQIIDIEV